MTPELISSDNFNPALILLTPANAADLHQLNNAVLFDFQTDKKYLCDVLVCFFACITFIPSRLPLFFGLSGTSRTAPYRYTCNSILGAGRIHWTHLLALLVNYSGCTIAEKTNSMINIRSSKPGDEEPVWEIIRQVISKGDSFVFHPDSSKEKMLAYWFGEGKQVYVAVENEKVIGTFFLKENQPDLGSHIVNAGYMVSDSASGKGVGKAMGLFSIEEARRLGYHAMQFNIVISSNLPAVNLWKKLGFEIIGEIPNAFLHQTLGYTSAYIMHRKL